MEKKVGPKTNSSTKENNLVVFHITGTGKFLGVVSLSQDALPRIQSFHEFSALNHFPRRYCSKAMSKYLKLGRPYLSQSLPASGIQWILLASIDWDDLGPPKSSSTKENNLKFFYITGTGRILSISSPSHPSTNDLFSPTESHGFPPKKRLNHLDPSENQTWQARKWVEPPFPGDFLAAVVSHGCYVISEHV